MGKYALLANIKGKVTKLKIACGVSIRVVRSVMAVNIDERPKPMRKTIAKTPSMLNAVKFAPKLQPKQISNNGHDGSLEH